MFRGEVKGGVYSGSSIGVVAIEGRCKEPLGVATIDAYSTTLLADVSAVGLGSARGEFDMGDEADSGDARAAGNTTVPPRCTFGEK